MTFLKKLGQFLAQAVAIASGVGPILAPFLGSKVAGYESAVVNDLTQISSIVLMAEAVNQTPGSGADKLKAATPLILQVLRTSQAFSGKHVENEALAEEGAAEIASGLAKFMNAIHPDEAKKA